VKQIGTNALDVRQLDGILPGIGIAMLHVGFLNKYVDYVHSDGGTTPNK
jgi:hypothetical protein